MRDLESTDLEGAAHFAREYEYEDEHDYADELVRWAAMYGHPEEWAKRAQALWGENESLRALAVELAEACQAQQAAYRNAQGKRGADSIDPANELIRADARAETALARAREEGIIG